MIKTREEVQTFVAKQRKALEEERVIDYNDAHDRLLDALDWLDVVAGQLPEPGSFEEA